MVFRLFQILAFAPSVMAVALSAPAYALSSEAFVDRAVAPGETPKFIRIEVRGYNIRTSPHFSYLKPENIDFHSPKGAIYAVKEMIQMENGVAVRILARGQDRWVYVPNWRRHDFQFCQTETCLAPDLADIMKILQGQNISQAQLAECGIDVSGYSAASDRGSPPPQIPLQARAPELKATVALPARAPVPTPRQNYIPKAPAGPGARLPPAARAPVPRPRAQAPSRAVAAGPMTVAPLWELAKPTQGPIWTRFVMENLGKHGRDLLNTRSLRDQDKWCPNYSRLNPNQRAEFWVHLIAGFNRYESSVPTPFNPMAVLDESTGRNPTRGRINPHTYSMGLGQLSYTSAGQKAYRNFCKFDWGVDRHKDISDPSLQIYDPYKNFQCQVGILNHWVKRDGGIGYNGGRTLSGKIAWRGGARFWSTLRYNNPATKRVQEGLKRFRPCW